MITRPMRLFPGPDAYKLIRHFEGERLLAYYDVNGYAIGYGHHGKDIKQGTVWTHEEAELALESDALAAGLVVSKACDFHLQQHQFDALVDLVYNVGGVAFTQGSIPELVRLHKYQDAGELIRKYNHVRGIVDPGLTLRRNVETNLFLYGTLSLD